MHNPRQSDGSTPFSFDALLAAQRRLLDARNDDSMQVLVTQLDARGVDQLDEVIKRLQGLLLTEQSMALVREVGEFLNENPYTKRWAGGKHPAMDHAAAQAELVDVLIFWANLVLLSGYSIEEIGKAWAAKVEKNLRRAASVEDGTGWQDGKGDEHA